jgi:hypothetical protein
VSAVITGWSELGSSASFCQCLQSVDDGAVVFKLLMKDFGLFEEGRIK